MPPPAHRGKSLSYLDALAILGLHPNASNMEVRRTHRRLVRLYHPDRAGAATLDRFLAVQAAYETVRAAARPYPSPPTRMAGVPTANGSAISQSSSPMGAFSTARPHRSWGADPGWRGGLWYWEEIAKRAAARRRTVRDTEAGS